MTTMIYRGVRHDGIRTTRTRTARALIYRGVGHDGLPREPARSARPCAMVYLGVRYTLALEEQQGDSGLAVPAAAA